MSDGELLEAVNELNRRLALEPQRKRAVYRDWYKEQLAANRSAAAIHHALAIDRALQSLAPSIAKTSPQLVLLVHGIRTQAEWEEMVAGVLRNNHCVVEPIRYKFFNALMFWCPLLTRGFALRLILWKVRRAVSKHRDASLSIIAHSFGTYSIAHILRKNPDIVCDRLLLCGSIVPQHFRWDMLPSCPEILNDCGSRDNWPIYAKILTWGFGPSGTFGFGTPTVRDRFHDFKHSDYFSEDFVRKFWKPWIHDQVCEQSDYDSTRNATSTLRSYLALLPVQWLLLALVGWLALCWWFGWSWWPL